MATVVVIGGGFSGTVTAVRLLRLGFCSQGGRLVVINRSGVMARGVAYGTNSDQHVLNVPAGRMSAIEEEPGGFVSFLKGLGVPVDGGAFVSRQFYGAYLESLIADAADRAPAGAFRQINSEVLRIVPSADDSGAVVDLADGSSMWADRVVLAIGNYPPEDPLLADRGFVTSRRYVRDPWCREAMGSIDRDRPVLLIGTGLTMVDLALQVHALGATQIVAVSRRGLLPQAHRSPGPGPDVAGHGCIGELLDAAERLADVGPSTSRAYLAAVRHHARVAARHGLDWRDVIGALRPLTPRLWRALPTQERARFLRHVRPFWEVHRHRMAPQLFEAFDRLRAGGVVRVVAGRIVAIREIREREPGERESRERECSGLRVTVRPRGLRVTEPLRGGVAGAESLALEVGTVINCTGPAGDTRRLQDPLFEELRASGVLRPDALGLGIETGESGAVISSTGRASRVLYYVGPFLRARDWEATAVPELRRAVRLTVEHVLEDLPLVPLVGGLEGVQGAGVV